MAAGKATRPAADLANEPCANVHAGEREHCEANSTEIETQAGSNATARHDLHFGGSRTPLATIVPDDAFADMWRVHWPDGVVSGMGNLTRCKEAARRWAEAGPPKRDPRGQWEWRLSRIAVPPETQGSPHMSLMRRAHAES